jgi:hypothetical protein
MLVLALRSMASRPVALWIGTAITAALLAAVIAVWSRRDRSAESDVLPQEG